MPTPLHVPRLQKAAPVVPDAVAKALADQVEAQPVAFLNWPQHPYAPVVSFRLGHTGDEIWLRFDVSEARVRGLETRVNGEVYKDSCVEFFFSFDKTAYYNLEMNCIGTPHLGYGPGRRERRMAPLAQMERLAIFSSLGKEPFAERGGGFTWTIAARIPLTALAFGAPASLAGVEATANLYKCGSAMSVPHYLTWRPIPTPAPDYHRPEFFGDIRFE